ncbi:hypothetical protein D3C73_1110950 [compost metagenome]
MAQRGNQSRHGQHPVDIQGIATEWRIGLAVWRSPRARGGSAHPVEYLKHGSRLRIGHAVEALWPETHLERRNDMAGSHIELPGLFDGVAEACQLLLVPTHARWIGVEIRLLARHGIGLWPYPKPRIGKTLPWEQRPRIQFAQRCDITVANDVARVDVVTFDDIREQRDQRLNLRFAVRVPDSPVGRGVKAWVDDLDTDRARVQPGSPLPLAVPGMPGTTAFIDQLINRGWAISDQVVAADLAMG